MSSPFMNSLDPMESDIISDLNIPSTSSRFQSLCLTESPFEDPTSQSVHILDDQETLLVKSEQDFIKKLKIALDQKVKVISIFGNTGEGKSYTLNHTFFDGEEVFRTSQSQTSCTMGVYAKYDEKLGVICLDTEGFLGIVSKEYQRTRLLLKVLAVSDVVIYRTRSERMQRDMYTFLGGASKAYKEHFRTALQSVLKKCGAERTIRDLGPAVIIFHETRFTETLNASADVTKSPEEILKENFTKLNQSWDGFSSLKYIGIRSRDSATSFKELTVAVEKELESIEFRTPRDPKYVYHLLKDFTDKFRSPVSNSSTEMYLPAFFTCADKCLCCGINCSLSMGHKDELLPHQNTNLCKFEYQYQNFVYLCKKCYNNGVKQTVEPSYFTKKTEPFWSSLITSVWSGYVIDCPKCGTIYKSREYWYGNKDPKEEAVAIETVHVWPGERSLLGSNNSAQRVVDGVTSFSNAVSAIGSQPTRMISDWITDKINPPYWRPNNEIIECFKCKTPFSSSASKHHCRACGEGFCDACSSKSQPVPSRGWYKDVRVCDDCYCEQPPSVNHVADDTELRPRIIGESFINSVSVVKPVFDIPKQFIKETSRPSYWTPDNECTNCFVCNKPFGPQLSLHHCRDCGKGVCEECSTSRKPVRCRSWDYPVRVCDNCAR